MALAPKYAALKLPIGGASTVSVHTLELFLDYVCPYSKKMFNTVYTSIKPHVESNYSEKLNIIFRPQIQPWHPSSTLCAEAATAVLLLSPPHFWPFSKALFDVQTDFFDVNVLNETRNATYARLAEIAGSVGLDKQSILKLLTVPDKPGADGSLNVGNEVTNDVKKMVRANRLLSVHVTPTVMFDGLFESSIESSYTVEQWQEWLKKNVA